MLNWAAGSVPWTRVEVIVTCPFAGVAWTRPRLTTVTRYEPRSASPFAASTRSGPEPDGSGRRVGASSISVAVGDGWGSGVDTSRDARGDGEREVIRSQPATVTAKPATTARTNAGIGRTREERGRIGTPARREAGPSIARRADAPGVRSGDNGRGRCRRARPRGASLAFRAAIRDRDRSTGRCGGGRADLRLDDRRAGPGGEPAAPGHADPRRRRLRSSRGSTTSRPASTISSRQPGRSSGSGSRTPSRAGSPASSRPRPPS